MAVTTLDTARTAQPIKIASIALPTPMARFAAKVANYFEHRKAVSQLQALSDRELADIGLTRSEIEGAVTGR